MNKLINDLPGRCREQGEAVEASIHQSRGLVRGTSAGGRACAGGLEHHGGGTGPDHLQGRPGGLLRAAQVRGDCDAA